MVTKAVGMVVVVVVVVKSFPPVVVIVGLHDQHVHVTGRDAMCRVE